jgi:hypothetical protein
VEAVQENVVRGTRRIRTWCHEGRAGAFAFLSCYNTLMKIIEQWLLFKYVDGQVTPLSKPFKTKAAAEKTGLKLPERERRSVAVGVIRIKK